jgi:hypothetical protein
VKDSHGRYLPSNYAVAVVEPVSETYGSKFTTLPPLVPVQALKPVTLLRAVVSKDLTSRVTRSGVSAATVAHSGQSIGSCAALTVSIESADVKRSTSRRVSAATAFRSRSKLETASENDWSGPAQLRAGRRPNRSRGKLFERFPTRASLSWSAHSVRLAFGATPIDVSRASAVWAAGSQVDAGAIALTGAAAAHAWLHLLGSPQRPGDILPCRDVGQRRPLVGRPDGRQLIE